VVVAVASARYGGIEWSGGAFSVGPFLTAVGLSATFLLTYAPYVSDYSRYLPEDTSVKGSFGWTFSGAFLGTAISEIVGIVLAVQFADLDTMSAVREVLGGGILASVVLLVGAVAIGGNNALNLYGGMLNLITAASSVATIRPRFANRVAMLLPTFVLGLFVALSASSDFITNLTNFLSFLTLAFVPWGAVNLLDFYLVRRGSYDVGAFFVPRGPYYDDPPSWTRRGIAWKAVIAYVVGVLAALPFVSNPWYTGAFSQAFGQADVSWVPGLFVTGAVFLALVGRARVADPVRA
jgi:NCS1 family nucleobase:cation symporter-1